MCKCGAKTNEKNDNDETPLHLASKLYDYKSAEILCKYGADVDEKNFKFESPLHILA